MLLSNTRLFFHGISKTSGQNISYEDVGSYDFELLLGDISSVETKFPTYIIIKDKDNNEFKLIVMGKEKWKNEDGEVRTPAGRAQWISSPPP